jgi:hypothetical protein
VNVTAAELWKIFDEECRKLMISALLFGDCDGFGRLRPEDQRGKTPEDLTVWENVLKRIVVRKKTRFDIEFEIDPATGEPKIIRQP